MSITMDDSSSPPRDPAGAASRRPARAFSRLVSGAALFAALTTGSQAHDFWLLPGSFQPAPGSTLAVGLRVGESFPGDPVPRRPERVARFVLIDESGEHAIEGDAGDDPAGRVVVRGAGDAWVVYHGRPVAITLEAESFESYLREEGLETVIARRAERGQTKAPGRELYARCAKALVRSGTAPARVDVPVGLPLELVPVDDPRAVPPGERARVRVLRDGAPQAGALVRAVSAGSGEHAAQRVRTDASGIASFAITGPGLWRVVTVHMDDAAPESGADWESLWASLTFETFPVPAMPEPENHAP